MPVRTFNYTRRKRIRRDHAQIEISQDDGGLYFEARLSLAQYELPKDARVFLEAYRQTTYMRFDFGEVGRLRVPTDRSLSEFDCPEGIRFRVKVVADEPSGLLLAQADGIRPRQAGEKQEKRIALIPVVPDDLGEEVWRLEFDEFEPLLKINRGLGSYRDVVMDPLFIALVFPSILRDILWRILSVENHRDTDDPDDWRSRWLKFATLLPNVGEPPPQADADWTTCEEWIERAVAGFCRQHHIRGRYERYRAEAT